MRDRLIFSQLIRRHDDAVYRRNVEELTEQLNLAEILRTPTRTLSLGQRMRCEIAASLAFASGCGVSQKTAEFFLTGMMTDTGGFKFSNTNGEVLRMAAKLLDAGANLEKLVNILFFSKPEKQLRFESELVSRQIKIACSGKFAYAFIPQELLDKYNFSLKEDEGIIDILREIDGVVIAMLVHHQPEGFKISLRSKEPRCPVAPIAAAFGGGGHLMAAGATADLPDFESLEKIMLEKVAAALAVLEENI